MKCSRLTVRIAIIYLAINNFGFSQNQKDERPDILSAKVLNDILKVSGADSIFSLNSIVFRQIGSSSILVVDCSLIIASIEKKMIPEDIMHSRFTFISRNGSPLTYEKREILPRKILENEFIIPKEKE